MRLLADAAVEANYTIAAGTFTIDFNGKKLTVAENNFFAAQTAEVTLTDSASIKVGQPCVPNAAEGGGSSSRAANSAASCSMTTARCCSTAATSA